jgi:polyhydroxyalkanoate synthesis regulator phasin
VRNLEKKISNLVEDFNSFADDVYGKIETLEKQVSAALTDSYGDQGLLTKVEILSERVRKFEEELRYAPKVIARNDDF